MLSTDSHFATSGRDADPWSPPPAQPIRLDAERRRRVAQLDAMHKRDGLIVPPTLAMIEVPVGPHTYTARLVAEPIPWNGSPCRGLCDGDALDIMLSAQQSIDRRRSVFFHELAHAWDFSFNPTLHYDQETIANIVGIGLAMLPPRWWATVEQFIAADAHLADSPLCRAASIRSGSSKRRKAATHE